MTRPIPLQNCATRWVLSGFADEAGGTTAEQVAAIRRAGFHHVDLRGIDGFNIADLPLANATEIRRRFDAAGIRVAMFGSPLGKTDIADDFEPELQKLEHLGRLSEVLGCSAVRVFSYYNKARQPAAVWERESLGRLARLRDRAGRLGLVLYHENELDIFGDKLDHVLAIAATLRDPEGRQGGAFRLIFDFDNYNQSGQDVWQCWLKLRDLTDGFHLKDSDARHQHVLLGKGAGRVRDILADALARSWHGPLSLEPHLQHAAVMATRPSGQENAQAATMTTADVFHAAAEQAKLLLGEIKAPVV